MAIERLSKSLEFVVVRKHSTLLRPQHELQTSIADVTARDGEMKFSKDGPDIPETLINKHAEQAVIMFCGAGVSMDAGLPPFQKLVDDVAKRSGLSLPVEFSSAVESKQFDFALSIVERQYERGSTKMRRIVAEILSKRPKTLDRHNTILRLSRVDDDSYRLVTTNFDRLFIKATKSRRTALDAYPGLPSPKKSRWSSIVHLHGILPENNLGSRASEYFRLILTSGDFGEAYLTDANCSRFLVELMRNFVVVFVGYSISDPVLRYLLDAIAVAENRDGSGFNKPYAFAPYFDGNASDAEAVWKHRSVEVILYEAPSSGSHSNLFDTLSAWADLVERGQRGRETIALNEAQKAFIPEDTFTIDRMLWAISDPEGIGAKALWIASSTETAGIEWLGVFAEFGLFDLEEAIEERNSTQENASSARKPKVGYRGSITTPAFRRALQPTSRFLVCWLIKHHLDKPKLLQWVVENGGSLSEEFCRLYSAADQRNELSYLKPDDKKLWNFLTSSVFRASRIKFHSDLVYFSIPKLESPQDVFQFLRSVSPVMSLSTRPLRYDEGDSLSSTIEVEVSFPGHHSDQWILEALEDNNFKANLYEMTVPLTDRLIDAMRFLDVLGRSNSEFDITSFRLPSISDHAQNEYVRGLGILILLVRNSFDSLLAVDADKALLIAQLWKDIDYPVFRRLYLYAAVSIGPLLNRLTLLQLTQNNGKLLWSSAAMREVKRYLRRRVRYWSREMQIELIESIRLGPSRALYKEMTDTEWSAHKAWLISRLLLKVQQGGVELRKQDSEVIPKDAPPLPDDSSDEFIIFSMDSSSDFFEEADELKFDEFEELSIEQQLELDWNSIEAESLLTKLYDRKKAHFEVLIEQNLARDEPNLSFWRPVIRVILNQYGKSEAAQKDSEDAPAETLQTIAITELALKILNAIEVGWLSDSGLSHATIDLWRLAHKSHLSSEQSLVLWDKIWRGVIDVPIVDAEPYQGLTNAINEPSGRLMEFLLQDLWPLNATRGMGLPDNLKTRLNCALTSPDRLIVKASTVVIASRLQLLHALDKHWARDNLLPYFDWEATEQANTIWTSFLWKGRIDVELFDLIKKNLFKAVSHKDVLNDQAYEILIHFIVLGSLDLGAATTDEVRTIIANLSTEDLSIVSEYLLRRMKNTKVNSSEFWVGAVKPWIIEAWPRNHDKQSGRTREDFALIALYADEQFGDAFATMDNCGLLGEVSSATELSYFIRRELRSENENTLLIRLIQRFPRQLVELLDITRPHAYELATLADVLEKCRLQDPTIEQLPAYNQLRDFIQIQKND